MSWALLLSGPVTIGGNAVAVGGGALVGDSVLPVVRSGAVVAVAVAGVLGPEFEFLSTPMTTPMAPSTTIAATAITVGTTHFPDRRGASCADGGIIIGSC